MVAPSRPPVDDDAAKRALLAARRQLSILLANRGATATNAARNMPRWQAALLAAWSLIVTCCYLYGLIQSLS